MLLPCPLPLSRSGERSPPPRGVISSARSGSHSESTRRTWEHSLAVRPAKVSQRGLGEVQEMIDVADFAVGLSRQLYGLTMPSERPDHRLFEQWHPLGPVGVITAFNFPVAVWAWNALIGAVCGDTIIWKPSPITPLSAVAVTKIVNEVMAGTGHEGVFALALGGVNDVGEALVNDPRVLHSATGSCRMGREVGVAVARRLGRSLLELGGNNAVIVLPDADLELAARGAGSCEPLERPVSAARASDGSWYTARSPQTSRSVSLMRTKVFPSVIRSTRMSSWDLS